MPWTWTDAATARVRETLLAEVVGGALVVTGANGAELARVPLTGASGTVVGEAEASGKAVRAVVQNRSGEVVASAPAASVVAPVQIERGARITVTLTLN